MDGPGELGLLQRFLAENDAPCPGCGYNLRGAIGEKCPECARPIALGITRSGPAAALTWFLLLALGWVFAAGVMNSCRNVSTIRSFADGYAGFAYRPLLNSQSLTFSSGPTPAPGAGGFWSTAWQVVPVYTWLGTAWSSALVLGCGVGLLLMMHRRTRPFSATGDHRMVILACSMFAVYAAWHITNFVLEFS